MNLLSVVQQKRKYKLSFDGVDDEMTWSTPSEDIHEAVIVMETNGYTSSSGIEGFLNIQGQSSPYMLTGDVTGAVSGEVLTLFSTAGSPSSRNYTTDNIPSGLIELKIVWTGTKYKFVIDGSDMSMFQENDAVPLQRWNSFGFRNTDRHADVDLHSLTLYGSSGKIHEWPLNDGSGSTAKDIVGTNDATITGATWTRI